MSFVQHMAKKILYLNLICRCHWLVTALVRNVSSDVNVSCLGRSPVFLVDSWTRFIPE